MASNSGNNTAHTDTDTLFMLRLVSGGVSFYDHSARFSATRLLQRCEQVQAITQAADNIYRTRQQPLSTSGGTSQSRRREPIKSQADASLTICHMHTIRADRTTVAKVHEQTAEGHGTRQWS